MKILVIGSGGREHALLWKIVQSPQVRKAYAAPGNAGIASLAECVPVPVDEIKKLASFALAKSIDLTVVGPELPLTLGIVDEFKRHGLKICGPDRAAALIEGSKLFAKDLMQKYRIPTAAYAAFDSPSEAAAHLRKRGVPAVIKADGLASGKGVMPVHNLEEAEQAIDTILTKKAFGTAGSRIVIEDFLRGEEASFIAFTDGKTILPMPSTQDHKAIFDGDKGPNTGGMGAYSPAPVITDARARRIMDEVMTPVVRGMSEEGTPFKGILYAGLMIDGDDIRVLEFNARSGDPETQPILMRMKSDIVPVLEAVAEGSLDRAAITWDDRPAVCVVMASEGYPGNYRKGMAIEGLDEAQSLPDVQVFHAGTASEGGRVVVNGGRVLGVTALGSTIEKAIERAYDAASRIRWDGVYYRKDIGRKALNRVKQI
jgi:phosphoribosylamine--glycine ligase